MAIIILAIAISFALGSIGIGIFVVNRKAYSFRNINIESSKLKAGAICLIAINAYSLINLTKTFFLLYTSDWIVYDIEAEVQTIFTQVFSLAILLLYIAIGIFLLLNHFKWAFASSISALAFTLFKSIFLNNNSIISAYFTILPSVAVLLSIIVIFVAINGKTDFFYHHSKLVKLTPYLILLGLFDKIFSLISYPHFSISVVTSFALLALNFFAFWLIVNNLTPLVQKEKPDLCEPQVSKKKHGVLVTLSILILPAIIYLVSSINKTWLFVGGVALALLLPITLACAKTKKVKIIVKKNMDGKTLELSDYFDVVKKEG